MEWRGEGEGEGEGEAGNGIRGREVIYLISWIMYQFPTITLETVM
jgi:hypothetical protein